MKSTVDITATLIFEFFYFFSIQNFAYYQKTVMFLAAIWNCFPTKIFDSRFLRLKIEKKNLG